MEKKDIKPGVKAKLSQKLYKKVGKRKIPVGVERLSVEILKMKPKSRTVCFVKITEKGKGYDVEKNKYTGIRRKTGWVRGERKDFNQIIECKISNLQ